MTLKIKIKLEPVSGSAEKSREQLLAQQDKAISAAANMAASMMQAGMSKSIVSGGKFGARWTDGLHVTVEHGVRRAVISTTHDIPYAGIFEEGGTIEGKPLLWIGLSGTDAEGVRPSEYNGGLFSIRRGISSTPLMFSISDKKPKYFGIESVTIPQKWHLRDAQASVMANFRSYYDAAFNNSGASAT